MKIVITDLDPLDAHYHYRNEYIGMVAELCGPEAHVITWNDGWKAFDAYPDPLYQAIHQLPPNPLRMSFHKAKYRKASAFAEAKGKGE
jgi:hypothetical protein